MKREPVHSKFCPGFYPQVLVLWDSQDANGAPKNVHKIMQKKKTYFIWACRFFFVENNGIVFQKVEGWKNSMCFPNQNEKSLRKQVIFQPPKKTIYQPPSLPTTNLYGIPTSWSFAELRPKQFALFAAGKPPPTGWNIKAPFIGKKSVVLFLGTWRGLRWRGFSTFLGLLVSKHEEKGPSWGG